jgi:hypothetical protein
MLAGHEAEYDWADWSACRSRQGLESVGCYLDAWLNR